MGQTNTTRPRRLTRARGSGAFWGLLGLLITFGIASLPSIGMFVLAAAAVLIIIAIARRPPARTLPALLIGAGVTPLYIAAMNIRGPGLVCTETVQASQCSELLAPWPFAITGVVLVVLGSALLVLLRHR